jgi:hypothetical protein
MLHVIIPGKWRKESVFLTRDWPGGERRDQGLQLRVFLLGAVVRRFRADHAGGGRPVLVAAQESVLVWRERQPTHKQPTKQATQVSYYQTASPACILCAACQCTII